MGEDPVAIQSLSGNMRENRSNSAQQGPPTLTGLTTLTLTQALTQAVLPS